MIVGCVCPSYKRPQLLGRAIHCFEQQTHKDCELIVIEDSGLVPSQEGERWRIVSVPKRFDNLGAKRQYGISLLSPKCEGYMCFDDDDVYFPHAVASASDALERGPWAQCRHVYETVQHGVLGITPAFGKRPLDWGYGGCWSYRLDELRKMGGYENAPGADDLRLAHRFYAVYGESENSTQDVLPWYWYCREPGVQKVSDEGIKFWEKREGYDCEPVSKINVGWNGPNLYEWKVVADNPRPW